LELPTQEDFSLALRSAWSRQGAPQTAIPLPGGGIIAERNAKIFFSKSENPLIQGLRGLELDYSGRGLEGRGLPLAVDIDGAEQLAFDDRGSCCFSIAKGDGKSFIRFGAMLAFSDLNGQERSLFSKADELRFFANAMDFCGVEYFPQLPEELNALKTKDVLLLENISTRRYAGPVPRTKNGDGLEAQPSYVEIPPLQSVVLPLGRSGETQGF
jgi:hypothetical protein